MSKKDKQDKQSVAEPTAEEIVESDAKKGKGAAKKGDYTYVIKNRKARVAAKHRRVITVVGIIVLILILLSGLLYGFYTAVEINNFKIYVETSGKKKLSLSPNANMLPSSEMIELIGPDKMTNTTFAKGKNIAGSTPIEENLIEILKTEGSFTTVEDYYIAGTFYMQNVTQNEMLYGERVYFTEAPAAYKALRVMIIRNNEIRVYAAPQSDEDGIIYLDEEGRRIYSDSEGYFYYNEAAQKVRVEENGEPLREEVVPIASGYTKRIITEDEDGEYQVEVDPSGEIWYTELFYDKDFAVKNENIPIAPNETVKYSVIIWFEGWDSDCVDGIIGDEIQLSLSFCCY